MKRFAVVLLLLAGYATPAAVRAEAKKRPMTIDDLFRFQRVSDPQISPDGKTVAYVVGTVDLKGNRSSSNIWLVSTEGGKPRQLTNTTKKDSHPRWSPDGKRILFESTRSGDSQLWIINVNGGEAKQLTTIATEASTALWSPDGKHIAFVSTVYPEYSAKAYKESNDLNKKRLEEIKNNPVKARVFKKLFFRHWDEWVEDKRKHLFVMPAKGGEPQDVTPGDRDAYPTSDTFSIGDDFTFSPDGKYLLYTAPPERNEAWSTNYDICRVPITGGKIECLTKDNKAADGAPRFSPDGKRLAYRAQKQPGFEADRWQLLVVDVTRSGTFRGKPRSVTAKVDASVESFAWGFGGSKELIFTIDQSGTVPTYTVKIGFGLDRPFVESAVVQPMEGSRQAITASAGAQRVAFLYAQMNQPPEVFAGSTLQEVKNISHVNDKLLAELDLPLPESVTVKGAGGTPMQMWVLKPPGFDPKKKWPLAFLVHGGPQGAWEDGWSYRWCPELWAAQGYVVALPNPRGSTGFGQKYVDEISGDWGGKCYDDLMAGLAYLEKQPYIDKERMAAAGASFGGYMMNWFQGHTTKFKTLITHCGVYNFDSMYALTDELWFDEWEHGGLPWDPKKRDSYEKFSPHRYARNFKTPMLIIHNDLDFRVPVAEGLQLFTTLQRLKVPSKMINFPDEGHWVLKPANSAYWHKEVFAWLKKYAPPGGRKPEKRLTSGSASPGALGARK
jgi:dipeptidyl aminopeptidase/acylaminoacyl peptidase